MLKLKKIEEDNFLIPKKKEETKAEGEAPAEAEASKTSSDGDLSAILQNEVRQLHFKLR